jgi:hypothetical protein
LITLHELALRDQYISAELLADGTVKRTWNEWNEIQSIKMDSFFRIIECLLCADQPVRHHVTFSLREFRQDDNKS